MLHQTLYISHFAVLEWAGAGVAQPLAAAATRSALNVHVHIGVCGGARAGTSFCGDCIGSAHAAWVLRQWDADI
eukprot:1157990-Pelagomonas_calceolata.AAC.1